MVLMTGLVNPTRAEAWVPGLEWVGFDPANNISPRGDSLRVAIGLDYRDAAPVSGRRVGFGDAKMSVDAEATFDFAQKLMHAKDASEVMGLQSEFLSGQMKALSTQVQELGQSAAKIVVDAAKPKL